MLCVVGDLVEDVVVRLDGPPQRGTDTGSQIERRRGGSAANVASFAAAAFDELEEMASGHGTTPVRFIGRVGTDSVGGALIAELSRTGVDVRAQRVGRTGVIVVLVEQDGERSMFTDRGAATELRAVDPSWFDTTTTWLHVPAYSLIAEPIGEMCLEMVRTVHATGARISIDVSSVGAVDRFGRDRFNDLIARVAPDVAFATAEEAEVLARERRFVVVVKRGPEPVVISWPDGRDETVPVDPVEDVVDSTGAGDAFAAGFIAATMTGSDAVPAVRAGCALAARTLRVAGASLGRP